MRLRFSLFRHALPLLTLAVTLLPLTAVRAQRLEDGELELSRKMRPIRETIKQLFKGDVPANPNEADHKNAAVYSAKDVVYPLVWNSSVTPKSGAMEGQVETFFGRLNGLARNKANTATFTRMYCKAVIDSCQEVIQRGKPIAAVNAARMLARIPERQYTRTGWQSEKEWADEALPRLAEGNADHYAAVLTGLLANPKTNDGVRYWVLRGLKELLSLPPQTPPLVKADVRDKAIKAAAALVEKKVPFPKGASRSEVTGYCVLRREAVKVVAEARVPALADGTRPALTLLRVAAADPAIVPPPRIDERVEAAVGLASVRGNKDYQPDYAAQHLVRCVNAFLVAANANREAAAAKRAQPWKVHASRLTEALTAFKAEVKTPYVAKAVDVCLRPLQQAERGEPAAANEVTLDDSAAKTLFKNVPESAVKGTKEEEDE